MESYTGKVGEEDILIRKEGKDFLIMSRNCELIETDEEGIRTEGWDDWCNVRARSIEEAKANYDAAFDQWKERTDNDTDA